ncbi:heme exporter protein B [Catalinimonas alkaloidigena]|uniref:heme exporter protein CcmB n=1 Tax=Catalinimonas alkaloidigena TaxID=1075417 RepID=UPI00240542E5|nr:heme exporter protein CcmB [Catalinimonas alkaloidigena]MDF9800215.1 heme exporter protein B [Catalinimonas alkaloidigena]
MLWKEIKLLVRKEIVLEWRQRYAFNGILLYVVSAVFVCYLSFNLQRGGLQVVTWNALFWIIMLFAAINAISKSFMQENYGRQIYYYTLSSPQGIILSKMLYNVVLMLILAFTCLLVYALVLGNPIQHWGLFIANLFLGAAGFSTTLTMVSGIASKTGNSSTLMAILGFPVMIPMLLMVIRVSKNAIDGLDVSVSYDDLIILVAINGIVGTVSYILFPYLWRS